MRNRINTAYSWAESNVVTAILVCSGSAALLAVALTTALGLYTQATYVQKTDCSRDPTGDKCAALRLEIARGEPLKNPCTSYQRVTSRRGRNCSKFFVPRGHGGASDTEVEDAGEDALGAAGVEGGIGAGGLGQGRGDGHGGGGGGTPGGTEKQPKSQEPQHEGESGAPDGGTVQDETGEDQGAEEASNPDTPVRSGLEHTVDGVDQTVKGATEAVNGAGCKLLKTC